MLFDPKEFWSEHDDHQMDSYRLSKRQLKATAKQATMLRQIILDRANRQMARDREATEAGLHAANQEGKKVRNRGSGIRKDPNEVKNHEYMEIPPGLHRHRSQIKNKIQQTEMIQIVH